MLWESIKLAMLSVRRNLLRSILTLLGIVIGVGAVIALMTIGSGATQKISADIAKLGSNMLIVRPGAQGPGPPSGNEARSFNDRDVEALRRGLAHVVEGHRIFTNQTVTDNLLLAGYDVPRAERDARVGRGDEPRARRGGNGKGGAKGQGFVLREYKIGPERMDPTGRMIRWHLAERGSAVAKLSHSWRISSSVRTRSLVFGPGGAGIPAIGS